MAINLYSKDSVDSLLSPKLSISSLSNAATSTLNATAPTTDQVLSFDGTDLVWATVGGGSFNGGAVANPITIAGSTYDSEMSSDYFGVELSSDHAQYAELEYNKLTVSQSGYYVTAEPNLIKIWEATNNLGVSIAHDSIAIQHIDTPNVTGYFTNEYIGFEDLGGSPHSAFVEHDVITVQDGSGMTQMRSTGITFPDSTTQSTAANPFNGGTVTAPIIVDESATSGFTTTYSGVGITMAGGSMYISQEEGLIEGFNITLAPSGYVNNVGSITFSDSTVQTTAATAGVNLGDVFSISNVQEVTWSGSYPSPGTWTITFRPVNTYIAQGMTLVVENADGSISQDVKGAVSTVSPWTYTTGFDTFPSDTYLYMVANGIKATIPINYT